MLAVTLLGFTGGKFMSYNGQSPRTEQQIHEERQRHEKKRLMFKILGAILAAIGLALTVVALIDFFKAFSDPSKMPQLFFLAFIGMPLFAVGMVMMIFGFRKDIATFVKNDSVPIMQQVGEEMTPTIVSIGNAVRGDKTICPTCGEQNDPDAGFCKKCGKQLVRKCPYCGQTVDHDSEFCKSCGKKI